MKTKTTKRTPKKSTFEYNIISFPVTDEDLFMSQTDPSIRDQVQEAVKQEINKYAKKGWKLHSIGPASFVIERQA